MSELSVQVLNLWEPLIFNKIICCYATIMITGLSRGSFHKYGTVKSIEVQVNSDGHWTLSLSNMISVVMLGESASFSKENLLPYI